MLAQARRLAGLPLYNASFEIFRISPRPSGEDFGVRMAVRKRSWTTPSGRRRETWIVDYVDQAGDRHIRAFDGTKDADAFHAKVSVDIRAGIHTAPAKSITVAEAAENWITSVELEDREATTVAQYRQHSRTSSAALAA